MTSEDEGPPTSAEDEQRQSSGGDSPRRTTLRDRVSGRTGEEEPAPPPWRVEGMPRQAPSGQGGRPRLGGFWWVVLGFLALNWVLMLVFTAPAARTDISYDFFRDQVAAGNVQTVSSSADTIRGELKKPVDYPPGVKAPTSVDRFATQRPAFAQDDLLAELEAENVTV